MKIHLVDGRVAEAKFDQHTTIGALRSKIVKNLFPNESKVPETLEKIIHDLGKILIRDINKNLCVIYHDDPSDVNLVSFLKAENTNFLAEDINITAHVRLLDPYSCRSTKYNPKGVASLHYLTEEEKQSSAFFKSIKIPSESKNFTARLKEIDFRGDVPDHFLDPITNELMNAPKLTSDTKTYDARTIEDLKKTSPFTRKPFTCIEPNLLLRAQIEDFVSEQEQLVSKSKMSMKIS